MASLRLVPFSLKIKSSVNCCLRQGDILRLNDGSRIWNRVTRHLLATTMEINPTIDFKKALESRKDLIRSKRVVIKLGSAVITREDQSGLALGRLASIVEQISSFQNEGKQMLLVTSGAVAFGKQRLSTEMRMSMSMRETLSPKEHLKHEDLYNNPEPRAAAAVGQSGLMALYDAMFSLYGVNIAQVLVTKPDFYNIISRENLKATFNELLALNIVPIVNTNDAVVSPSAPDLDPNIISDPIARANRLNLMVHDNDSLAAHLAAEVGADLIILMSDVDGVYDKPPTHEGARILHTYSPKNNGVLTFGQKSKVGLGGMESKVKSAAWALERGVAVVICNGNEDQAITKILHGRKIGTFFTDNKHLNVPVENLAARARKGSRQLQSLAPEERADILISLANLLQTKKEEIIKVNNLDIAEGLASGLAKPLLSRLSLTSDKLNDLSNGLQQVADSSRTILGQCLKHTLIADDMHLKQITVPIGVLMVIFESRPDSLPQIAGLSIATANGLLLKGGKEAAHTNQYLFKLVQEALAKYNAEDAIALVSKRDEISELLTLDGYIDLIIPRGSKELIHTIQDQSKSIPVLGHAEGICHVYIDEYAHVDKAIKIIRDSKCDYPSACNAMETLLLHKSLINSDVFVKICSMLKENNVTIYSGPRLAKILTFGPPSSKSMRVEYGSLECSIEVVDDVHGAIDHINTFGSSHTDVIVTENDESAAIFLHGVDSACVFKNSSSRFADGYRFGFGAEVGISTSRIHARGPVGLDGLMTTKWILEGTGQTVEDFKKGAFKYKHEVIKQ